MLSKNNKILVGCLALLLVMSVGYALFSDTITINGSATAKGEFELTTTCDMDAQAMNAAGIEQIEKGSITDAKISCEGNVVNASATLGYPGSFKYFRVMVTNTGTIPAKLNKVVELNDPTNNIISKENNSYVITNIVSNDDKTNVASASLYSSISWVDDYSTSDEGSFDSSQWYDEQLDAVLDPGETAYFYVYMEWSESSTVPGDTLSPTLNVEMDWEQVTE